MEAAQKPKSRRKPLLTEEQFEEKAAEVQKSIEILQNTFTGTGKKKYNMPEGAPQKPDYTSLSSRVAGLHKKYAQLSKTKKPKKTKTKKEGESSNRGFKQPRFFSAEAVKFVNAHAALPADLKVQPIADLQGIGVFTSAQMTQTVTWYATEKGLKHKDTHSYTKLDDVLIGLLSPYFKEVGIKPNSEGEYLLEHNQLQKLLPKLAFSLPIPPSILTAEVKALLEKRAAELVSRTQANRKRIKAEKAAAKAEKAAAKAAAAAAVAGSGN